MQEKWFNISLYCIKLPYNSQIIVKLNNNLFTQLRIYKKYKFLRKINRINGDHPYP